MGQSIASIYGSGVFDPSLFSCILHSDATFIIGGDFNLVFNPEFPRLSTAASQRNWQSTHVLKHK